MNGRLLDNIIISSYLFIIFFDNLKILSHYIFGNCQNKIDQAKYCVSKCEKARYKVWKIGYNVSKYKNNHFWEFAQKYSICSLSFQGNNLKACLEN